MLKESIEKIGLIVPILVRRSKGPSTRSKDRFIVVDGQKRLRVFKQLKKKTILCKILHEDMLNPVEIEVSKISEPRKDDEIRLTYSPPHTQTSRKELARALRRLMKRNPKLTFEELSVRVERTVTWMKELLKDYPNED